MVTTLVGSPGKAGYAEGSGTGALFNTPYGLAATEAGLYVADTGNNRVRLVSYSGATTLFAGTGEASYSNGPAPSAGFDTPISVVVAKNGDVYIADAGNNRVRRVTRGMATSFAGDGNCSFAEGVGEKASFCGPAALAFDDSGSLYIVDCDNNRIRKATPLGQISTLAGSGTPGFADGVAGAASFSYPSGIAVDPVTGSVFVSDRENHRIRAIDSTTGAVVTLAGSDAEGSQDGLGSDAAFNAPYGMGFDADSGALYVADRLAHTVRKLTRRSFGV